MNGTVQLARAKRALPPKVKSRLNVTEHVQWTRAKRTLPPNVAVVTFECAMIAREACAAPNLCNKDFSICKDAMGARVACAAPNLCNKGFNT